MNVRTDYATTMVDLYRNADDHAEIAERVELHVDIVACALFFAAGFLFALLTFGG